MTSWKLSDTLVSSQVNKISWMWDKQCSDTPKKIEKIILDNKQSTWYTLNKSSDWLKKIKVQSLAHLTPLHSG